jgi:hypothetical protein
MREQTPEILLSKLKTSTYYALLNVNGLSSRKNLFDTIDSFLTEERIDFLYKWGDIKTNREIIEEVLEYCKHLRYEKHPTHSFVYLEKISLKLVQLAGTDNELINKIYNFSKQKKLSRHWDKYKTLTQVLMVVLFFTTVFYLAPDSSSLPSDNRPTNGDLNSAFNKPNELKQQEQFQEQKDSLIANGWAEQSVDNGQLSSCYNFNPKTGSIDNYLEIVVGGRTDVAIKVMNIKTDNCIRYVFINSGSTYKIQNIPEGQYYLKIAYGKNWLSKTINGQCIGRFIRNPIYEKGEKILDYNLKHDAEGYKAPSFRVSLDVIGSSQSNSFDSAKISENEFNQ